MGWRTVVDMASLLGGVFALIAMWLYLKPTVIVTIETYEYVPGTGNRRLWSATQETCRSGSCGSTRSSRTTRRQEVGRTSPPCL